MVRFALALVWAVHFLPLRALAALGQSFGMLLYWFGRERRRVARTNLTLCFPALSARAREALVRRHFRALGRSFLERGLLWWASQERIERLVRVEGAEHRLAVAGRPIILLAPHFVGCEMGGTRVHFDVPVVTMFSRQKNAAFDAALRHGRSRFSGSLLYSRQEGLRPIIRALRAGHAF